MKEMKKSYVVPQVKVLSLGSEDELVAESLPLHEETEAPHVTDDSQVYVKPASVWDDWN